MVVVLLVVLVVVPGAGVVVLQFTQQFGRRVVPADVVTGSGSEHPVIVGPGQPLGGSLLGAEHPQPRTPPVQDDEPRSQYKPSIGHQTHSPTQGGVG